MESALPTKPTHIPGLIYVSDFLTPAEEASLVADIQADPTPWSNVAPKFPKSRMVKQYGHNYLFSKRSIASATPIAPIPAFVAYIIKRMMDLGVYSTRPDQLIVGLYRGAFKNDIAAHVDHESFGPEIAGLSLLSARRMVFQRLADGHKETVMLEPRSLYVMRPPVRNLWKHSIPPQGGDDRISLTFRTVLSVSKAAKKR